MIKLRGYQEALIAEARQALAKHKHIIVQSPTGSGKGVLIGSMASMSVGKHNRVLILAHSEEILKQDANHARKWGVEVAEVYAKTRKLPDADCCCMMVQTLRQRLKKDYWRIWFDEFNFLILDESHRSEFDIVFEYVNPKVYVLGLSATPARYGRMKQLALMYEAMVVGPSVQDLIDQGFLCRCKLYSLDAPSMDDVEWDYGRGDYSLGQMAQKFKSRARYIGAVENYQRICPGAKAVCFGCSSEQVIGITEQFCAAGIKAKYLLSANFDEDEDFSGERKEIMDQFKRGEFQVLVLLGIGTAGLDIPDIKAVLVLFATTSIVKWYQVLGRCSRPAEGKNGEFICLDFGLNYSRLGRYEDSRVWGLWHKEGAGGGVPPMKICPQCQKMIPVQYQDCPYCQYHFPTQQEIYQSDLQEIVAKNDEETIEGYVARKKLEGKKTNWILVQVCIKNPDNQKEAFMRAIEVLRTKHGESISPKFWFFFRTHILSKVKAKKKDESPSLFK